MTPNYVQNSAIEEQIEGFNYQRGYTFFDSIKPKYYKQTP